MLEFVDSDLYFVQDKNNFINPLLQVGAGSVEKITGSGSGSGGPKITGSDRIRPDPGPDPHPWFYPFEKSVPDTMHEIWFSEALFPDPDT